MTRAARHLTPRPGGSDRPCIVPDSAHHAPDDRRQFLAHLGQAVEVVPVLAAGGDGAAMAWEGQVVAHGGLALVQRRAQGPDLLLARDERQDHPEPGRIAELTGFRRIAVRRAYLSRWSAGFFALLGRRRAGANRSSRDCPDSALLSSSPARGRAPRSHFAGRWKTMATTIGPPTPGLAGGTGTIW